MNQQELLQKALETADLIAGGGELNPEQADKFITYIHDLAVMAKDARQIPMKAKKRDINKMGVGQRASVPAAEGQDPSVRKKPSFSKVTLDCVEIMTPFEITYDVFEDNIVGENLEDEIIRLFAAQIATDHEELHILGDTTSTDTYLALLDGWRKIAKTQGHLYEHGGAGVSTEVLGGLRGPQVLREPEVRARLQAASRPAAHSGRRQVPALRRPGDLRGHSDRARAHHPVEPHRGYRGHAPRRPDIRDADAQEEPHHGGPPEDDP